MDKIGKTARSKIMKAIRAKDTKPEMIVRRIAHAIGYRFRLHRRDLPGRPDLAFPKFKSVVMVHGCFWHQHQNCRLRGAKMPVSRQDYWLPKLQRNVARDVADIEGLEAIGWRVMIIWECETADTARIEARLRGFLR